MELNVYEFEDHPRAPASLVISYFRNLGHVVVV
jgi:hypothetical protein